MRPEDISQAHNPLLPAALVAIRRAAKRARREARLTGTAVVIARHGRIVRLEVGNIREQEAEYPIQMDNKTDGNEE